MKVLIDANIALDILLRREEFLENSYNVLKAAAQGKVLCYLSTKAVMDAYYVLERNSRDEANPKARSKAALEQFVKLVTLVDVTSGDISYAFASDIPDFEDAVVAAIAKRMKMDCIITRNDSDFINSPVPAVIPSSFLRMPL